MPSLRTSNTRLRIPRPNPSTIRMYRTSEPRHFASNKPYLLFISRGSRPRPQLSFLHPSTFRAPTDRWRQISTENKLFWKAEGRRFWKWFFALNGSFVAFLFLIDGINETVSAQKFPTPSEWHWKVSRNYRFAKCAEDSSRSGLGQPDWVGAGRHWDFALLACEHKDYGGQKIKELDHGRENPDFKSVRMFGFDIQDESEPWRRGYHEILMGNARAAEQLEGWVYDTRTMTAFPGDLVIGPSNPNRKPILPTAKEPPHEDFCMPVPYWRPAYLYYTKILTTNGFTSGQRLQGAIGLGDYYLSHAQPDIAYENYKTALDVATSTIPTPSAIVDTSTGIIKTPSSATANIIQAATSMATYHAKTEDYTNALPAYLSVLRARRAAPLTDTGPPTRPKPTIFDPIKNFFSTSDYGPAPPTGDEPFARTPADAAEDAVLMTYIGEILYATHDAAGGLAWTRDGIALAEECARNSLLPHKVQNKGLECAQMGLRNMQLMLAEQAEDDVVAAERAAESWWPRWLGGGVREGEDAESKTERWMAELGGVEERQEKWRNEALRRLVYESRDETFNPLAKVYKKGFWSLH